MAEKFATVEEYIASFPDEVQAILREVRQTILDALPGSGEKISYAIPTATIDGKSVIYYSGWMQHIGVYPVPDADAATQQELDKYRSGKGTLKFPLDRPIPHDLIARMAKLLAEQLGK